MTITRRTIITALTTIPAAAASGAASATASEETPDRPSQTLLALIAADKAAAERSVRANARFDEISSRFPGLQECPHVIMGDSARTEAYSEEDIRSHLRSAARLTWPKPSEATLVETENELINELRSKRQANDHERQRTGLTQAGEEAQEAYQAVNHSRAAVLAFPCASLVDVHAKVKHLLSVIDVEDDYDLLAALRSLLPATHLRIAHVSGGMVT